MEVDNFLTVKTADGKEWQIMVLDTFSVDEYPHRNYIIYTLGEQENPNNIKSYISVLNETDNYFSLVSISNEDEREIVKEAYKNMIIENGEL